MTTLNGILKTTARGLSSVALAGCALSLCVHLLSLVGFYSKAVLDFQICLCLGVFPFGLTAILAQKALLSAFPTFAFSSRVARASRVALLAGTPIWLKNAADALTAYAVALFVLFAIRNFPNMGTKLDELRLFSAYAAAFYTAPAAILTSYANTERSLRPDEIEL